MASSMQATERAVLWDLDGTLLDSSSYHHEAWRQTLAAEGFDISYAHFVATFGHRNDVVLRTLIDPQLPEADIRRISEAKEMLYRELLLAGGAELLPGAREWLDRLAATGWRQALASMAPRSNIDTVLRVLGLGCFDAVVAGDEVSRGKPDPEVFQRAARAIDVPPERCVVVEDTPAGVEGARRAGMRSIGVGTAHGRLEADIAVECLDWLPVDALESLVMRIGPFTNS